MREMSQQLKAHLQQPVTTTCRLLKINLKNGDSYGLCSLDVDITYEGTDYSAINGFNSSAIASDSSFGVDNAEGYAFLSASIPGITLEMAKRGELDDATWELYLVNYEDLTMGHVRIDKGDLGEVRIVRDTIYIPELLSYAMRLRQSIGHVDSRTCRAVFGAPANSQRGCGFNADALWVAKSVLLVGDEDNRVFSVDSLPYTEEELIPGRIRWTSGDNVSGRSYQVELVVGTTIQLLEPTPFPIQPNDNFDIRPDCDKLFTTCRDRWGNSINFKGENLIPVQDGTAAQTPGTTV